MLKFNFRKVLLYSLIVIIVFILDRFSKIYVLNLFNTYQINNFYISPFLNLHLIWNTGVGFGFLSSNESFFYNLVTLLIILINIIIIIMIFKHNNYKVFFLLMIFGGSLGNLFDRLYYFAVPDFFDLHYNNFHWFVFNVADIFISLGVVCLIFAEIFLNKNIENENK